MSQLYGTLYGGGRARPKTRCATRETNAAAQSWEGSLIVCITAHPKTKEHRACIMVGKGSATSGRLLWEGPLADLLAADRLEIAGVSR